MHVCSQNSSAQRPGNLWTLYHLPEAFRHRPVLRLQVDWSEVSRPDAWLKLSKSKWLTTLQTTRRGTRSPRSTTKGTLAARWCSSVSWWSSAVARRSTRLQNATETCKGSAAGSRPHLSRVRSIKDLHPHNHNHFMQLCRMQEALVHVAKSLRHVASFLFELNYIIVVFVLFQSTKTLCNF